MTIEMTMFRLRCLSFWVEPSESLCLCRINPGTETLGIPAMKLDTSRPRNGLSLSGRRGVLDGVHLEGAFTLSTKRREHMLLLLLAEGLAFPSEEMQEKNQR